MQTLNDRMIEIRLKGPINNRLPNVGKPIAGEKVLLRISMIMCLFPQHCQIRTVEGGWTLDIFEEDFPKVEKAFRSAYLGNQIYASDALSVIPDKVQAAGLDIGEVLFGSELP